MCCIGCMVWFEGRQRNSERGSAECELEFLARVYGRGRYEFSDGNRHGATSSSGTDPVVCRCAIECGKRRHLNADLEQHRYERLYRERRLDGRASHLGYDNSWSLDDWSDLYTGLHGGRWHGDTLGHHHDCSAESDAYLHIITAKRGERRDSTLTWNTTNATSCTASGSWTGTKELRELKHRRADGQRELHADVHGAGGSVSQTAAVAVTAAPPTLN